MTPEKQFCPWCGKILPTEMPCIATCPHTHRHPTWYDRFTVWQSYSGMIIISMVTYFIGKGIGATVGGSTGETIGGTVGFFLPSTVFALLIR